MAERRTIRHEIQIEAPRDRVWSALARLDGFSSYSPMVKSSRLLTEQSQGVGAERRCDAYRPGHIDERVVDWLDHERIALEVIGGMPITGIGTWTLSGSEPTRVVFELEYAPRLGWIGSMMDVLMMRREMTKGFAANLAGLKQHVEHGRVIEDRLPNA
jgi:uncharacterized membrane protein